VCEGGEGVREEDREEGLDRHSQPLKSNSVIGRQMKYDYGGLVE
jgi:hypothetical protein